MWKGSTRKSAVSFGSSERGRVLRFFPSTEGTLGAAERSSLRGGGWEAALEAGRLGASWVIRWRRSRKQAASGEHVKEVVRHFGRVGLSSRQGHVLATEGVRESRVGVALHSRAIAVECLCGESRSGP